MTLSEIVDGLIARTITKAEGMQALGDLNAADRRERAVLAVLTGIGGKEVANKPALVMQAYEYAALVVKVGNKVAG